MCRKAGISAGPEDSVCRGFLGSQALLQGMQYHLNFAGQCRTSDLIQHICGNLYLQKPVCPSQLALSPLGSNSITILPSGWQREATQKEVGESVAVLLKAREIKHL